jgi:hypothetical protein
MFEHYFKAVSELTHHNVLVCKWGRKRATNGKRRKRVKKRTEDR